MPGLLARGDTFLSRALPQAGGVSVTYTRGAQSVSIAEALVGSTLFGGLSDQVISCEWSDRDFLVEVADLVLGGSVVRPQRGDRISEEINEITKTFEVMAPSDEPVWRYSGPAETVYRIHTKRVS